MCFMVLVSIFFDGVVMKMVLVFLVVNFILCGLVLV